MSLLWNWGSRNLLRRCMPYSSSTSVGFSNISTLSSTSPKSSIISSWSPLSPTSLSSFHLYTPLRFKGGVKTNSGAKKRFRVRGSGSIKRYVVFFMSTTIISSPSPRTGRKRRINPDLLEGILFLPNCRLPNRIHLFSHHNFYNL